MAKIVIVDFIDIGTGGAHDATTWRVYKDVSKSILLDESIHDEVNLTTWHTPLAMEDGSGMYYRDLRSFYVEITIHANGHTSDPFMIGPFNQLLTDIKITDGDNIDIKTTLELDWYKE